MKIYLQHPDLGPVGCFYSVEDAVRYLVVEWPAVMCEYDLDPETLTVETAV